MPLFQFGYVVFERPSSVTRAMEKMAVDKTRVVSTKDHLIEAGVAKWR